jgi:NADH:ubiquinone oxidoreductase subunit E
MNVTAISGADSTFQRIKSEAIARVQDLYDGKRPVIMVGTATCGRAAGALEVLQAIKERLAEEHVNAHVVEVGCMGHCYAEPLVVTLRI